MMGNVVGGGTNASAINVSLQHIPDHIIRNPLSYKAWTSCFVSSLTVIHRGIDFEASVSSPPDADDDVADDLIDRFAIEEGGIVVLSCFVGFFGGGVGVG